MGEFFDLHNLIKKEKHKVCEKAYACYFGAAFTLLLSYLVFWFSPFNSSIFFLPLSWGLAIYFAVLGSKAQAKFISEFNSETSTKAQIILKRVTDGDFPGRFYLYLKPFKITHRLLVKNPSRYRSRIFPSFFFPTYFLPEYVEWESLVAKTFEDLAPLLGLGSSTETVGANYIEVKKWQKAVFALMEQALLIFIVPSDSEGTKWEIDMLKRGNYLSKCIFILPESLDPFNFTISRSWLNLKNSMEQIGIEIPEYRSEGVAFSLDDKGKLVKEFTPFSFSLRNSFFSLKKEASPQDIVKKYFSVANDREKKENSMAASELKSISPEAVVGDKAGIIERKNQISRIFEKRTEKKRLWYKKLEYFEKEGYFDFFNVERRNEQSFEEQVVIRFIEAICFDAKIIQFLDIKEGVDILKYTTKYFRIIKSYKNDVYIELHQQNSKGVKVVRLAKITISGFFVTNIRLIDEKLP